MPGRMKKWDAAYAAEEAYDLGKSMQGRNGDGEMQAECADASA